MTELCGKPSAVLHASTMKGESAAARCPKTSAAARQTRNNWIRRFKLGGSIRAGGGRKKIFQKPLTAGTEWATFLMPLRTGAPFFLLKDGLTGRRQKLLCARRPVLSARQIFLPATWHFASQLLVSSAAQAPANF